MKKQYVLSIVILLLCFGASAQPKEYSGKMHVTPLSLQQRGDSVYVELLFNISGVNVDSRHSISLIPVLVAPGKTRHLPEVVVKGRQNYNVYLRELSLMSKQKRNGYDKTAPYAVVDGFKPKAPKMLKYSIKIGYEPWMVDARLDIYEDLCGCGNPSRRMGVSQLVNVVSLEKRYILEDYSITPSLAYVQPVAEAIKRRVLEVEVFLNFAVNKIDIRPGYMDNSAELGKITDLINEIKNDSSVKSKAINVIGYASPEGTLDDNRRLSEGRAKALVDYLLPRFNYPRSLYKVVFGGENWKGLETLVEKSDMQYKQQVLDILEDIPVEVDYNKNMSRKKALMNLKGGEPYRYMLKEFYPSLRKAICKIDFEVDNFDVSQAKEVVKKRPQNLSLNEIFLVANTYEKGSQEFVDLFETAVRLFPDDITANLNAASAALARNDLVSAERYLEKIENKISTAEYFNALGVLWMLKGDYDKAQAEFYRAISAGSAEAKQNLDEIAKKRENIEAKRAVSTISSQSPQY